MSADKAGQSNKAYHNRQFMDGSDARPLRLLAEYLEPMERFEDFNIRDTILVFGSARIKSREAAEAALETARETATKSGDGIAKAERDLLHSRYYEDTRELAFRLTEWSKGLNQTARRFVICSGGGPGIMEAANRGASEAKGENMGLGISLPMEQGNNPYITRRLDFEFHYFFMRKFWFLYLAKAVVLMPGGFGTMDELFESLTLVQTGKMTKALPIVLYGNDFWDRVIDFDALIEYGTISPEDVNLFHRSDTVDDAFEYITCRLLTDALGQPGICL
jgi:uncharacterized protein (TIGR00730 family)